VTAAGISATLSRRRLLDAPRARGATSEGTMQNQLAQRALGIGGFVLFLVVLNVASYFMGCGYFFY
jgi:hypothetical protein